MTKIIKGDEEIVFKPTTARLDCLEVTVASTTGTTNVQIMTPEVMDKVWEAYVSFVKECNLGSSSWLDNRHKFAVCSLAQLSYIIPDIPQIFLKQHHIIWELELNPFPKSCLSQFVSQQCANSLLVYPLVKSVVGDIVSVETVSIIFPEVQGLMKLIKKDGHQFIRDAPPANVITNPYLLVLHAAPEFKGFLGGAIHHAEAQGKYKFDYNSKVYVAAAPKPSLAQLVDYAAKIGVPDITSYLAELSRIPIIKTR